MPKIDTRPKTKGNMLNLDTGRKTLRFVAGGGEDLHPDQSDRVEYEDLLFLNGEVELKDGSRYWAVIGISPEDAGEHWFSGLFLENGDFVTQDDPDFLNKLGKTSEEVYGYRYRYWPTYLSRDHHINYETGWSR
jgi:hypothetical protein